MEHIDKLIEKYNDSLKDIDLKMNKLKKENNHARKKYITQNEIYSNCNFLLKPFYYFDYSKADSTYKETDDMYTNYKSRLKELKNDELHKLIASTGRYYMKSHPEIKDELIEWENEHKELLDILESSTKISKLTKETRRSIKDALDDISEAKVSEYGDMAFADSLSSANSTSANFDASHAVFKAERLIKRLNKLLCDKKSINDYHYNFHKVEQADQLADYFLGGIFDAAGSVMSINALDRTGRELKTTFNNVADLDNKTSKKLMELRKCIKEYEQKMLEFKNSQREKIIPLLKEHGIDLNKSIISEVKDLYAE